MSILLLIAGTYTPLVVLALRGWTRLSVLAVIWGGTAAGILARLIWRSTWPPAPRWLITSLFIALDEDDRAYMMTTVPAPMRLHPIAGRAALEEVRRHAAHRDLSDPYAIPLPVRPGHHPHSRHAVAIQHRPS